MAFSGWHVHLCNFQRFLQSQRIPAYVWTFRRLWFRSNSWQLLRVVTYDYCSVNRPETLSELYQRVTDMVLFLNQMPCVENWLLGWVANRFQDKIAIFRVENWYERFSCNQLSYVVSRYINTNGFMTSPTKFNQPIIKFWTSLKSR